MISAASAAMTTDRELLIHAFALSGKNPQVMMMVRIDQGSFMISENANSNSLNVSPPDT